MTPSARIAAAIEILDSIIEGLAAEQALTRWGRQHRFAGSKDRAAIRDHVFDVLRQRETVEILGGGTQGRAMMHGLLRAQSLDPADYFTGEGYAPAPLLETEMDECPADARSEDHWNLPAWILPEFQRSLGAEALECAQSLRKRAPINVRVNLNKVTLENAINVLAEEGIKAVANSLSPAALTVVEGARRLRGSECYENGLFDFQDAASQAVVDALPKAAKCLDYCAGGGGKSLAMAAQPDRVVYAHDIDPKRMKDIGPRAARSGVDVTECATDALTSHAPFDLVLCDAPCSGSGAWRRAPAGKWTLTQDRLDQLCAIQDEILNKAAEFVSSGGTLVYVTCSVLKCENEARVAAFLAKNTNWRCSFQRRFAVTQEGDGFFATHLTHR
ncbi:MAG: RsmB/NOP family class I SAM-dependent RNA methyltransferase [Roseobacter sp.]